MPFKRTLKPRPYTLLLGVLFLISTLLLLVTMVHHSHMVQSYLLKKLLGQREVEVEFSSIRLNLWSPLRVTVYDLALKARGSSSHFFTVKRVELSIPWPRIVGMDLLPQEVVLISPQLQLDQPWKDREFKEEKGISLDAFIGPLFSPKHAISLVWIVGGKIKGAWKTSLIEELNVRSVVGGSEREILGGGIVRLKGATIPFRVRGKVAARGERASGYKGSLEIITESISLAKLPSFHGLSFEKGEVDLKIGLSAHDGRQLTLSGTLRARDPHFSLVRGQRKKAYLFNFLDLSVEGKYCSGTVELSTFAMKGPGFQIRGKMEISSLKEKGDSLFSILVSSPPMDLKGFKEIFPTPLVSSWVEGSLFSALSGGRVEVNSFYLKCNGREGITALKMKLDWEELGVSASLIGHPLDRVSGRFLLNRYRIWIRDLAGKMGDSEFRDVQVEIPNLSGKDINIKGMGLFHLPDLLKLSSKLVMDLDYRPYLEQVRSVSGVVMSSFEGRLLEGGKRFKLLRAKLDFRKCAIDYGPLKGAVHFPSVKLQIGQTGFLRLQGEAQWHGSLFRFTGSGQRDFKELGLIVRGKLDFNPALEIILPGLGSYLNTEALVPINLYFSKDFGRWRCDLELELDEIKVIPSGFMGLGFMGEGNRAYIRMSSYVGGAPSSYDVLLALEGSYVEMTLSGSKPKGWDVALRSPALQLKDLLFYLNGKEHRAGGELALDLQVHISREGLHKMGLRGEVVGRSITLGDGDSEIPIKLGNMEARFSGKELVISNTIAKFGELLVELEARLKGWESISGGMKIRTKALDVASLAKGISLVFQRKKEDKTLMSSVFKNTNLRVHLEVESGNYRKIRFSQANGEFVLYKGALFLERFNLKLPHGELSLKGHLKRGKGKGVFLLGELRLQAQPVAEIFQGLNLPHPIIQGHLTMESVFYSQAEEIARLLKGLKGRANFLLAQGKILKSNLIIKILEFLSLQKIFIKEPPDLSKGGFYYKTIGGCVDIEGGVIKSDSVVMKSPIFNAIGRGKWDLSTMKIKGEIGVQPFVAVDAIVKRVPVVGYLLTGKDSSILVYHFKVKGSFNEPELSYVPLKHLPKSIAFFLGRVVYTPARLFKNLYDFLKGLKAQGELFPRSVPSQ